MPSPEQSVQIRLGRYRRDVRIDTGYVEGGKVTPFYDPMISKVIVHAQLVKKQFGNRNFFSKVKIEGVKTNIPLFNKFLKSEEFCTGDYSTSVLATWMKKQKEEIVK